MIARTIRTSTRVTPRAARRRRERVWRWIRILIASCAPVHDSHSTRSSPPGSSVRVRRSSSRSSQGSSGPGKPAGKAGPRRRWVDREVSLALSCSRALRTFFLVVGAVGVHRGRHDAERRARRADARAPPLPRAEEEQHHDHQQRRRERLRARCRAPAPEEAPGLSQGKKMVCLASLACGWMLILSPREARHLDEGHEDRDGDEGHGAAP
jgi:hypothetical protein